MEDADLDKAVDLAIKGGLSLSGQAVAPAPAASSSCARVKQAFTDKLVAKVKTLKIGQRHGGRHGSRPAGHAQQRETVLGYIAAGRAEATLLCGGEALTDGDFIDKVCVSPAVFTDAKPSMRIAREEIFGPVLAILEVGSYAEAIAMAN